VLAARFEAMNGKHPWAAFITDRQEVHIAAANTDNLS
jgi:hypothetical protein